MRRKKHESGTLEQPIRTGRVADHFTVLLAAWINSRGMDTIEGVNRRLDGLRADMNDRFGEVNRRLDRIDETLNAQSGKVSLLEERTSPLARRG